MTVADTSAAFDIAFDDLAAFEWRIERSGGRPLRDALVQLAIAILAGAAVLAVLQLLGSRSRSSHSVGGGVGAAVGLAVGRVLGAPARVRRALAAKLRADVGRGPLRCTVVLDSRGATVRTPPREWRIPWANVDAVYADGADCVIHAPTAHLVVPERAFADAAARERFLAAARALRDGRACLERPAPAAATLREATP